MKAFVLASIVGIALLLYTESARGTGSYTTTDPPVALSDNADTEDACQTVDVPTDVSTGDIVNNMSLTIVIDHTWVGDVTLELTGPNCGPLFVMHRPGVVGQAGTGGGDSSDLCSSNPISLDEGDPNDVEEAGSAAAGDECIGVVGPDYFFPNDDAGVTNFNACEGTDGVGTWTLCAGDYAAADLGTLQSWTLDLFIPVELMEFTVD